MTDYAVQITRLSYSYPDGTRALEAIDFDVRVRERVALVGPSGAGKSTLLLHLNGILRGTGTVRVMGQSIAEGDLRSIRRQVGLVFQDPNDQLFCPTVLEDVVFGPLNLGMNREEIPARAAEALRNVGLEQATRSRSSHHLSHGERKRVALASVLVMNPAILVLDEPTANLDPRNRRQLIELMTSQDTTLILGTHDLEMALALCSRAVLLDRGKIWADGAVRDLLSDETLMEGHGLEVPLSIRLGR
jgi:cobalt/nickel transport system ATP-binding protein